MYNGHFPTDKSVRSVVGCSGYVTAVAVCQNQRFYSGLGVFNFDLNWCYLSSTPRELRERGAILNKRYWCVTAIPQPQRTKVPVRL
jgi:hypothetical protein